MTTTAWIVPVWRPNQQFGRILVAYIAGFESADEARQAVTRHLGDTEGMEVKDAAAISPETAQTLKITRGQVYML